MRCRALPHAVLLAAILLARSALGAPAAGAPVAGAPAPLVAAERVPPPIAPPPSEAPRASEPWVMGGLLAGVTTAVLPLVIGSTRAATGATFAAKNKGYEVAAVGLTLAPIMAHVAVREWKRAAIFGILPAVGTIAMTALLETKEQAAFRGTTVSRSTFVGLFTFTLFSSALGIVDVTFADKRAAGTGGGFIIGPGIAGGRYTLEVGGPFPL